MGTTTRWPRSAGMVLATIGLLLGLATGTLGVLDLTGADPADRTSAGPPAPRTGVAVEPAADVPRVPGTTPATRVPAPTRLEIPTIGVDERLEGRGLRADGSFDTPDFGDASWYRLGPRPGEPGGAVVVAHVHGPAGPDVFWDLATLEPGDQVRVHRADAVAVFVVDSVEQVPKEELPYDRIWPDVDATLLRLITCGGTRTPDGYPDNTVVYAHLSETIPTGSAR
ncbi:sortase [Nocardioides carbamazepini]|uniref:sortase domain-containing protein n=1 Tax=Nocardioides carbamazepini TaxID=2854259 RepID=UPI002149A59E|nr:sortase [Nocardioides carbamazepini]MCR1783916.1 sortase [Nocardioides carbamazepini]